MIANHAVCSWMIGERVNAYESCYFWFESFKQQQKTKERIFTFTFTKN